MELLNPYVKLWGRVPLNAFDQILWIERAGRTCYRSEDKIIEGSGKEFVQKIINRGHTSVLEHSNFVFRVPREEVTSDDLLNVLVVIKDTYVRCLLKEDYFYIYGNMRAFLDLALNIQVKIDISDFPFDTFPASILPQFKQCREYFEIPKELWTITFEMVTDRAVTHELVRHRTLSFSQESQRYCRYGQLKVIRPFYYSEERLKDTHVKERFMEFVNGIS